MQHMFPLSTGNSNWGAMLRCAASRYALGKQLFASGPQEVNKASRSRVLVHVSMAGACKVCLVLAAGILQSAVKWANLCAHMQVQVQNVLSGEQTVCLLR